MNIEVSTVSPTRKSLKVTFEAAEVDAEHKKVVAQIASQARVPGFRQGKLPHAVAVKRFSKEIQGELANALASRAYRDASEKEKLKILGVVKADAGTPAAGKPATVELTVDLEPEFVLPDYKGLALTIAPVVVEDAEVEAVIENIRRERADFAEVERAAVAGDYVKVKYAGTTDGKPLAEIVKDRLVFAQMDQTWEEAGTADSLIPGFGPELVGLSKGGKKTVTVTFPQEFSVEALRGLTGVYEVEALEVRERRMPELTEEFVKTLGVASVDELRKNVRERVVRSKEQQNDQAKREQVTKELAAKISTEFPEDLIEQETQQMLRRFIQENLRRGVPQEEFDKRKEELHANARSAAVDRLKVQFALARIAAQEKLTVSQQDFVRVLSAEASRSGVNLDKLAKDYSRDRERLRALQNSILLDKALEFVVSQAKVTEQAAPAA